MTEFQHKIYRLEWVTEVFEVDQYDYRPSNARVFYEKAWPTRELAVKDLDRVSELSRHNTGRRISDLAHHPYHHAGVRYREVVVDE